MVVSVIIPCYNPGVMLSETLQSLEASQNKFNLQREVIIVNDGSKDPVTLQILDNLDSSKYKVIHQENKGCAPARNEAVRHSRGEYLFFLDADNKVRESYLDDAYEVLSSDPNAGVAYGKPHFFGEDDPQRVFEPGPFDMHRMLQLNYIDVCAMIKRQVWDDIGGFTVNREIWGHEDWDLWIKIGLTKWQFRFIDKVLYDYRVAKQSLLGSSNSLEDHAKCVKYLMNEYSWTYYMSHAALLNRRALLDGLDTKPMKTMLLWSRKKAIYKLRARLSDIKKLYRKS